jgi:hypothetical protein
MGRTGSDGDPIRACHSSHFQRHIKAFGPIVDSRKNMAMQIDQVLSPWTLAYLNEAFFSLKGDQLLTKRGHSTSLQPWGQIYFSRKLYTGILRLEHGAAQHPPIFAAQ